MEYYKVLMNKQKIQLEDLKEKHRSMEVRRESLTEELRTAEEKNNQTKFNMYSMRKTIQEKDLEFLKLKDQLASLEQFSVEKEKLEKKLHDAHKQNDNMRRDLE